MTLRSGLVPFTFNLDEDFLNAELLTKSRNGEPVLMVFLIKIRR